VFYFYGDGMALYRSLLSLPELLLIAAAQFAVMLSATASEVQANQ
jgi:hypothetical protein